MKPAPARGRGRPALPDDERREYVRSTRLTATEAEALTERAERDECAEGDVLRAALARYLRGRR